MRRFHVHLFAVVRYQVPDIDALDARAAIQLAQDQATDAIVAQFAGPRTDFAEEYSHFLVDVVGDHEYGASAWFYCADEPLLANLRRFVAWYESGASPTELSVLVAEARQAIDLAV